uniref:L-type lectin-like domain-containing protein n=1 Tax=Arion vulgaris TaxID=1028688 RepID=A0A0B7AV64_9EUPU
MAHEITYLYCLLVFNTLLYVCAQAPKKRFEYKLSFKGPHLVQRDNSVPFWEYFGDALAGDEGIRITPSLRSKKGSVWSKNKVEAKGWEIEAGLRVTGRGRVGADGMALWFTEARASHTDNPTDLVVFGASDRWKGLGVFFDSFDNDGQHNNPHIMAIVNDGTVIYDHQNDGSSQNIGGCLRDFRNKPFPVRVKVEYYNQLLTVKIHNGLTNNQNDFEICLSASNVVLPTSGYIGVSAATGGLADDHDVLYLLTHTLHDPTVDTAQVSEDERLKFDKEFQQYQEELDRAKQDYRKEHPDQKDDYQDTDDQWFQSQNEKEMKQIFDGQNVINIALKELNLKLDQLIGKQEIVISRVNSLPVGQGQPSQTGQQQLDQQQVGSLQKYDLDRILGNQNTVLQQLGDLRLTINDIQLKATNIQGKTQGGLGVNDQLAMHEIKDRLNAVSSDMKTILNKPQANLECPPPSSGNCLSATVFFVALVVQFALTIGYFVYRSNKEAQAKKFY